MHFIKYEMGFPCGSTGKESACNVGDLDSIHVGKIPWRREKLPTPGFWPGEFHGLYSPWGDKEMKHQIIPDEIPAQVIVGSLRIDPKSTASHITECFLHCMRVATH